MTLEPIPPLEAPLLDDWRFALDPQDTGLEAGWQSSAYQDDHWERVAIPHTWNATGQHAGYEGIAWYRLPFVAPAHGQSVHVRIRFDAIFYLARVWLNGEYLGEHEGGYTPFEFEISSILQPGANHLAVRVDNRRAPHRRQSVHLAMFFKQTELAQNLKPIAASFERNSHVPGDGIFALRLIR